MKTYILGFVFNKTMEKVLLIHKNRPDWQRGKINGLGGKLELAETPVEGISREIREESALDINPQAWVSVVTMTGLDWQAYVFSTRFGGELSDANLVTDEQVEWFSLKKLPSTVIPNLNWLIPLCYDALKTGVIKTGVIEYNV